VTQSNDPQSEIGRLPFNYRKKNPKTGNRRNLGTFQDPRGDTEA
jgi:hypothetical protein